MSKQGLARLKSLLVASAPPGPDAATPERALRIYYSGLIPPAL